MDGFARPELALGTACQQQCPCQQFDVGLVPHPTARFFVVSLEGYPFLKKKIMVPTVRSERSL